MEIKIIIALITQKKFLKQIKPFWKNEYIQSEAAKLIAKWVWKYYDVYEKAPKTNIDAIYLKQLKKKKIRKDLAEEIEQEILPRLSEMYENGLDITYILNETKEYFSERQITLHNEEVNALLENDELKKAKNLMQSFKAISFEEDEGIDLSNENVLDKIDEAFDMSLQRVIQYKGALGEFWNDQLVRGGLVAIMAKEKMGKTWLLIDLIMTAYEQGKKVAFFQAGDMTENQFLVRVAIYLAKRSNQEQYCGINHIPEKDCVKNQIGECSKNVRETNVSLFKDFDENYIHKELTASELIKAADSAYEYKPCWNCKEWKSHKLGTVYLRSVDLGGRSLKKREAKKVFSEFFIKAKRTIKISTHPNGTLTMNKIEGILDKWKDEGFEPELIITDYADIMEDNYGEKDERKKTNNIWKGMRALSQKLDCLYISPTQADAESYDKYLLTMKNFSEDKRKISHVTAMYGLNSDKEGREKSLGIIRFNKIVIREGDFHVSQQVKVLQHLEMGMPVVDSFF